MKIVYKGVAKLNFQIISCAISILSFLAILLSNYTHNKNISALIEYRVGKLEEKQDKHNSVIERQIALECEFKQIEMTVHQIEERVGDKQWSNH